MNSKKEKIMKVLGKKSLSSVITIFLIILLILCTTVIISGGIIVVKLFNILNSSNVTRSLIVLYLSSIPAEILIIQFLGIFISLRNSDVFNVKNLKRLKISYIASITMGCMYMINSIVLFINHKQEGNWIPLYLLLTYIIALVFLIFGIGLVVLSEIYKKAIQYKEENELTI